MSGPEVAPPNRIVFHVDIDSFYPSVEAQRAPALRGRPLIVGADPKGGKGRGVVVSCSYEARKLGVRSGTPISRAFKMAPEAVYIRPNFQLYSEVSGRIMKILETFADKFEQVSIDEAFLDVSERLSHDFKRATGFALQIKSEIVEREGLTCSIGVAPNKSSAKIASDLQKPNGLTVVEPESVTGFLAPLPVRAISGIGSKTEEFLASKGITTIGELQQIPGKDLVSYFGKTGVWLWGVAHGLEQIDVKSRPMRSMNSEHTFDRDVSDKSRVYDMLQRMIEKLHKRVLLSNVEFRVVGIKIRFTHFQTYSRENTLPLYTNTVEAIHQEARNLFREFETDKRKVRLIGVFVSEFRELGEKPVLDGASIERWISKSDD